MKVAIPTDQPSIASKVCQSFGRAAYFLIYDTDSKAIRSLENHAAPSQGGTGVKAAQIIVDSGADVLLTPRCGENADAVLLAASIKLYKTSDGTIEENIIAFLEGDLEVLEEIHAGFHHGGR